MINDDQQIKIEVKKIIPQYTFIRCDNCSGYGSKGFNKLQCPSCKGVGVLKVPVTEVRE